MDWYSVNTAKKYKLGDYHQSKCDEGESVTTCNYDFACILRAMYYATEDETVESLDQIIPIFSKMKRSKCQI